MLKHVLKAVFNLFSWMCSEIRECKHECVRDVTEAEEREEIVKHK